MSNNSVIHPPGRLLLLLLVLVPLAVALTGADMIARNAHAQSSGDSTLSSLTVSPGEVIGFDNNLETYFIGVAHNVTTVTINAIPNHSGASVTFRPPLSIQSLPDADANLPGHQVRLGSKGTTTLVNIFVTSENGAGFRLFSLDILRQSLETFKNKAIDDFNGLYHGGNTRPAGIWSNGVTMWVLDGLDDKIYAYKMSDKTRDGGKDFNTLAAAGNTNANGIWSDGSTMYVVDDEDDKIYAYKMSDKTRDGGKDFNTLGAIGNNAPKDIWSDRTTMWVLDDADDRIYAYKMSDKTPDGGKDFPGLDVVGNDHGTAMWSNGATMWVSDTEDNKLYAYRMWSKLHHESMDFNTLSGRSPRGLWGNDNTIWVADEGQVVFDLVTPAKIFSYNRPRTEDLATDASLRSLTANPGRLVFESDVLVYRFPVTDETGTVTFNAAATHPGSRVTYHDANNRIIPDADVNTPGYQISLSGEGSRTVVNVVGTSQDDSTITYRVEIGRQTKATFKYRALDDFNALSLPAVDAATYIWSNGTTMWVLDKDDIKIYAFSMSDMSRDPDEDFDQLRDAGNASPAGIWSDGTTMWVADDEDDKIYAYRMGAKTRYSTADFNSLSGAGNNDPAGMWSDRTTMYVADTRDNKIYAYEMSFGTVDNLRPPDDLCAGVLCPPDEFITTVTFTEMRQPNADVNTLNGAGNVEPRGIWFGESTIWVADEADSKVYAYHKENRARDPSKDFNNLAGLGNNRAKGIWSDANTMWVANTGAPNDPGKIFSYNMLSKDTTLRDLSVTPGRVHGLDNEIITYSVGVAHVVGAVTVQVRPTSHSARVSFFAGATTDTPLPDADPGTDGHQVTLGPRGSVTTVTAQVRARTGDTAVYTLYIGRQSLLFFGLKAIDDLNGVQAAGNETPWGVWSDGTTMWVTDTVDKTLYAYSLSTKTRDEGKDFVADWIRGAGNDDPGAIWSDGTTMWVADIVDKKLYAYNLASKGRDSGQDFNSLDGAGNDHLGGIWSDGTTMWVADTEDDKLYAYNLSSKGRDSDKDFDTLSAAGNNFPRGIYSNGTTMWVADGEDIKLYAYRMSDKSRDASKDFNTLRAAGNDIPLGIWGDGDTLWVTQSSLLIAQIYFPGKIYSYNMRSSNDAALSGLTLSGIPITFSPDTTSYTVSVDSHLRSTLVTPSTRHVGASYVINWAMSNPSATPATVPLNIGANTITIEVTAEDGETTKIYTVSVTRLSDLAALNSLTLSGVSYTFDSETTNYRESVGSGVTSTFVTPVTEDEDASYLIKWGTNTSTIPVTVPLSVGVNVITIEVTPEDVNAVIKTYTVTIRRQSTDATLTGLTLSGIPFTFSPGTTEYVHVVSSDVESTLVTPTTHQGAIYVVTWAGSNPSSEPTQVTLSVGDNTITIEVTPEDRSAATETYTVTVRRQSGDAALKGLTLGGVSLTFDSTTTEYTLTVSSDVDSTLVTPTTNHDGATYEITWGETNTSTAPVVVPLGVGGNTITVEVTPEDRNAASRTYALTLTRQSNDADLSGVSFTLSSPTTEYRIRVDHSMTRTLIDPKTNDDNAGYVISYGEGETSTTPVAVPLSVGDNAITVVVTPEDADAATKTYTLLLQRAAEGGGGGGGGGVRRREPEHAERQPRHTDAGLRQRPVGVQRPRRAQRQQPHHHHGHRRERCDRLLRRRGGRRAHRR